MKKLIGIALVGMFAAMPLFATPKQDNDRTEGCKMTRSEWLKIKDDGERRAAFSSLSADCKIRYWQEKFDELKGLKWSKDELKHIAEMENFMNKHKEMFDLEYENREQTLEKFDTFATKWMQDGEKKFGWTKDLMRYLVADCGELTEEMFNSLHK